MKSIKLLILVLVLIPLFTACKSEYSFNLNSPAKLQINQKLTMSVTEKNEQTITSVQYSIDGKKLPTSENLTLDISINDFTLGKHTISALIFYTNKTKKISKTVYFLADKAPDIYTYKIINTYPHDSKAYTQGLEYHDGFLYESTGRNGSSSLRKVALKTGKVVKQIDIDREYFTEGLTLFNNKIYQLTWKKGIGFIYNLETFEKEGTFKYTKSIEGWGLTNNGKKLIKTDGSERIWFLNETTQLEENHIEAYTNKRKAQRLNELEYVNGLIYANVWQQNSIVMINATSGRIEGIANLKGLKNIVAKTQNLDPNDDVLNGIAYDKENNRLFVTGKHWGKLFEIELIKK